MLQQNATNVQQIATQGGGDRALMSVVQRLGNLFVLQTNFTDLSVKLETVQFWTTFNFQFRNFSFIRISKNNGSERLLKVLKTRRGRPR